MKFLMIGTLSLFSLVALANKDKDWEKLPFDQQKQMKTEKLEKTSAMIKKEMSCVNQSKTKADLKVCVDQMEVEKQAMMEEWKKKSKQSQESKMDDSQMDHDM